jgi:hypothetical protein
MTSVEQQRDHYRLRLRAMADHCLRWRKRARRRAQRSAYTWCQLLAWVALVLESGRAGYLTGWVDGHNGRSFPDWPAVDRGVRDRGWEGV